MSCTDYVIKNTLTKVCKEAVEFYGIDNQLDKMIEELQELEDEVAYAKDGDLDLTGLAEEIADVYIMMNQLCLHYGISERIRYYIDLKKHKLEQRIQRERKEYD